MKTKFKLVTNDYNYISFNFRMRQCWWTLYSIISVSLSFSSPFFIFYEFSPWAGWQRDMPPNSVDIITFLLSHPLLPIERMHHCHAAVIEHVHLVPHRELHQGTYQSLKKNTGRKRAILHQIVFMLQIIFNPQKQHHQSVNASTRLLDYLGFYNLHAD